MNIKEPYRFEGCIHLPSIFSEEEKCELYYLFDGKGSDKVINLEIRLVKDDKRIRNRSGNLLINRSE